MIRLNVFLKLENEQNKDALKAIAAELVEKSRSDKGCVAYDLFESTTINSHLMICETWQTREDLEMHADAEHFKRLVPRIQELASMKLEEFVF